MDSNNTYDFPMYNIGSSAGLLGTKSLPASATHYGGVLEYNVHNMHGLYEARATYNALANIRKQRPFVLSRSTFPGSVSAGWKRPERCHLTVDTRSLRCLL